MKFFEAFAGIGGFRLGMEKAGHTCVGSSEIDRYARGIYEHRFGKTEGDYGDIRAIDPAKLPDFEILAGGFPCQSHSVAGKRGGLADPRGSLFFDVVRIAKAKRVPYVFLENVPGLLTSDNGWAFWNVLKALDEIGMDASWSCLNTSTHGGLPQNRERLFIVGRLRGYSSQEIFPLRESDQWNSVQDGEAEGQGQQLRYESGQCVGAIRTGARTAQCGTLVELTNGVSIGTRVYDPNGISKTLMGNGGGQGAKTGLYLVDPPAKIIQRNQRDEFVTKDTAGACQSTMHGNAVSRVLTSGSLIRRLTPLETERLQGFPDGWTSEGVFDGEVLKISDTQRYRCTGNAVSVPIIYEIAKRLK